MALEQSENNVTKTVIHTISSVAEAIALLSSYTEADQHSYAQHEHELLHQALSAEANAFITSWRIRSRWDFMYLYEFFIPFPHFNDMALFLDEISGLSDESYLFYIFGGEVPQQQIAEALLHPDTTADLGVNAASMFGDKPDFMKVMFTEIKPIRASIQLLLQEISTSAVFREHLSTKQGLYEAAMQEAQAFGLEPLHLAQKLMEKTFRRVSNYQTFYFIPSYFLTPRHIRIFDNLTCIVIYGCYSAPSNTLERSQELEKQLKALSDRNRIMILRILHQHKEYGARLANTLDLTTATISHHLEILKQAGLIVEEKVGNIKYFELDHSRFGKLLQELSSFVQME